jgi:hypothetical protein
MLYVFSDGSVASDGTVEMVNGVEKGVWSGDNSSTAASFFLVYDPAGAPVLVDTGPGDIFQHQQLGWMRTDASVETSATPAGNNVNQMVDMIILNYMALHGEEGLFDTSGFFPAQGLGDITNRERFIAFQQMTSVSGGVLS